MRQCNRESFFYRAAPLSFAFMAGHTFMVRRGIMPPAANPRAGYIRTGVLGFIGYMIGKASYMGVVKERILSLENSPLADTIRQREARRQQIKLVFLLEVTRLTPVLVASTENNFLRRRHLAKSAIDLCTGLLV